MKTLTRLTALLLILVSCAHKGPQFTGKTEDERLTQFFNWSFQKQIERQPISMAYLGMKQRQGELGDFSEAFQKESHEMEKLHLEILRQFDRDKLSNVQQMNYDLYEYQAEQSLKGWKWRNHSYPVNQMFGVHSTLPGFMISIHKVNNEQDLKNYISRLRAFKVAFEQVTNQLMRSEIKGVVPPSFVFPLVINDIKNVIKGKPFDKTGQDSPLWADFNKKLQKLKLGQKKSKEYQAQAKAALLQSVEPAYRGLAEFLGGQEKRSNKEDGVWKLPDGADFYRYRLEAVTTTKMTPEQIHELGLRNVARIHSEMGIIQKKMGVKGSLQDFFKHMRSKKYFYSSNKKGKNAYLKKAKKYIGTMKKQLPKYFRTLPKADIEVKPVEAFREKSTGMAFYSSPSLDGKRPGIYYVNLSNMAALPSWEAEALAYHEGIPGHHMQLSIANELKELPMFRRVGHVTAYSEGWGLYSERLPKEIGFYQDPASDFGRLSMELVRACRLVVDTGIHSKRWTHDQAVKYLDVNLPGDHDDNVRQIRRYIVMPGQATAYMVGLLKILELREKSQTALGDKFNLPDFHDVILTSGAVPLEVMEGLVDQYIKEKKTL